MATQNNVIVRQVNECCKPNNDCLKLRTENQHVIDFCEKTIKNYTQCPVMGITVGQVNPDDEFNYYTGTNSVLWDATGNYNVEADGVTLKNPVNSFNEPLTNNKIQKYSDDTYQWSGSCSKPMITMALMALVDRGIIRLCDPIMKYYPEWQNMKILKQKFYNDVSNNKIMGLKYNRKPFVIADGQLNENVVVTLSDNSKDTIANFIKNGKVQKVDPTAIPDSYKPFAPNTTVYYIETQSIDLAFGYTYGTIAMAFSHQLGFGLFPIQGTPYGYNQLIIDALRDKGVFHPLIGFPFYYSSKQNDTVLNQLYPNGYTFQTWMSEILKCGLLSSEPGKVWEYEGGIDIGVACCEVAYQRFYKLSKPKPFYEIFDELILTPMNLNNKIFIKLPKDERIIKEFRESCCPIYLPVPNTVTESGKFGRLVLLNSNVAWFRACQQHDIGGINILGIKMKDVKELAYCLANYGVARNGKTILSKNAVVLMCETNYLHPNCDFNISQDESPHEGTYSRTMLSCTSALENLSFGLGGQYYYPRVGKEFGTFGFYTMLGWYGWGSVLGSLFYVNPKQGKYIVSVNRNGFYANGIYTYKPGEFNSDVKNIYNAYDTPNAWDTYGIDVGLSLYRK
jgi:hypothetical protein